MPWTVNPDHGYLEKFSSSSSMGAILSVDVDLATPPGTDPVVPDGSGEIILTGDQIAGGSTANVIRTHSLAANSITVEIQRSSTAASSMIDLNGVCHFDSAHFSIDANGFVSAGGEIATSYVTDINSSAIPSSGILNVVGGSVTTDNDNGIQTDGSSGSNTLTIELTNRVFGGLSTNDATPADIITFAAGGTAGTYIFDVQIAAYNVSTGDGAGYNIFGTATTNGASVSLQGTPDKIVNEGATMTSADANMVVSGNDIIIQVTGIGANNIDWKTLGTYTFID